MIYPLMSVCSATVALEAHDGYKRSLATVTVHSDTLNLVCKPSMAKEMSPDGFAARLRPDLDRLRDLGDLEELRGMCRRASNRREPHQHQSIQFQDGGHDECGKVKLQKPGQAEETALVAMAAVVAAIAIAVFMSSTRPPSPSSSSSS